MIERLVDSLSSNTTIERPFQIIDTRIYHTNITHYPNPSPTSPTHIHTSTKTSLYRNRPNPLPHRKSYRPPLIILIQTYLSLHLHPIPSLPIRTTTPRPRELPTSLLTLRIPRHRTGKRSPFQHRRLIKILHQSQIPQLLRTFTTLHIPPTPPSSKETHNPSHPHPCSAKNTPHNNLRIQRFKRRDTSSNYPHHLLHRPPNAQIDRRPAEIRMPPAVDDAHGDDGTDDSADAAEEALCS